MIRANFKAPNIFKKPREISDAVIKTKQINDLKYRLEATDYKIIKCSEYLMAGITPAPYDVVALNTERQALRDRINELEA